MGIFERILFAIFGTDSAANNAAARGRLAILAAQNGQNLDWQNSIVDLMKLLNMDSSLGARQALAKELGYLGDTNDTAPMNMWLIKEVMARFA